MKRPCFATVRLLVALLYLCRHATAGGTLNFVTLYSAASLPSEHDAYSPSISTDGAFPFGTNTVYYVHVSAKGYISMGEIPCTNAYSSPTSCSVVAPYVADIDTEIAGTVQYTDFDTYTSTGYSMSTVSSFIRDETGDYFYGSRMMVAEWNGVAEYGGSSFYTNTFQGILITDGYSSYAVFIYECGGMEWGGGAIGWQASSTQYQTHSLSGTNSDDIGCYYSNSYSAIVYKLALTTTPTTESCSSYEFTCDNGRCEPQSYRCDQDNDCGDNSDERGCVTTTESCSSYEFTCDNGMCKPQSYRCNQDNDCGDNSDERGCVNVGLIVGVSVSIVFLLIFVGVPLCVVVGVCCAASKTHRPARSRVVATTRRTGAGASTLVTSNQAGTSFAAPVQYPQQPVYKDAQFSCYNAPPSYSEATAFPLAAEGYTQHQTAADPQHQNTSHPLQVQGYPQAVSYPNQAYPPTTQPIPQPDGGGGSNNAGFLLQQ